MGCPIRKGGVGSPLRSDIRKVGGGGGGGGGQFASGPLRKVGGAIRFMSITKSGVGGVGGGGGISLQVHYEKGGGGGGAM